MNQTSALHKSKFTEPHFMHIETLLFPPTPNLFSTNTHALRILFQITPHLLRKNPRDRRFSHSAAMELEIDRFNGGTWSRFCKTEKKVWRLRKQIWRRGVVKERGGKGKQLAAVSFPLRQRFSFTFLFRADKALIWIWANLTDQIRTRTYN